jgi:adenosylcobinamide-GDP ribazoletransferase
MLATGCLHEDGLSDVADGFGGGVSRQDKLDIMRDSRIGTYGVAALALTILARWSAIATLAAAGYALPVLVAAHAGSRALFPTFMRTVPPARPDGLSAGVGLIPSSTAGTALAIAVLISLLCLGIWGTLVAALTLAIWFFGLEALTRRQIGGQTGDVLGTLQQGGEVIVLAVACAVLI